MVGIYKSVIKIRQCLCKASDMFSPTCKYQNFVEFYGQNLIKLTNLTVGTCRHIQKCYQN